MKFVLLPIVAVGGLFAQTTGDDPVSLFTSIGVGGLIAGVVYLWQRDTAKQRDRAMEALASYQPTMAEVLHAIQKSNEAHQAGTEASKAMSDALRNMPPNETWFRVVTALERIERGA